MKDKPCYSSRLEEALQLATRAFSKTVRKGTQVPYLTHLLQVGTWVAENGGDEDQFIAGILHDYLEDIPGATQEELAQRFGERVARLVVALSDSLEQPKPPWEERKRKYLEHLRTEPAEVKLISACDKLHNATCILRDLETIGDELWQRFHATKDQNLWYYRAVIEALGHEWEHPLLERLKIVVENVHQEAGSLPPKR